MHPLPALGVSGPPRRRCRQGRAPPKAGAGSSRLLRPRRARCSPAAAASLPPPPPPSLGRPLCGPLCPLLFLPGHSPRDRGPAQVIQMVTPPDPPFNHIYKHPFSKRSHGRSSAEDVSFGEPPLSPRWPWTSTCRTLVGPVRHRLLPPGRPARSRSSPSEPQSSSRCLPPPASLLPRRLPGRELCLQHGGH